MTIENGLWYTPSLPVPPVFRIQLSHPIWFVQCSYAYVELQPLPDVRPPQVQSQNEVEFPNPKTQHYSTSFPKAVSFFPVLPQKWIWLHEELSRRWRERARMWIWALILIRRLWSTRKWWGESVCSSISPPFVITGWMIWSRRWELKRISSVLIVGTAKNRKRKKYFSFSLLWCIMLVTDISNDKSW